MFRPYTLSYQAHTFQHRPHLPLAKALSARGLRTLRREDPRFIKWRASKCEEIFHPSTPDTLFKILDSRSTFVIPWRHADSLWGHRDMAVAGPDGLLSPAGARFRYGRKRRKPYFAYVKNALCMKSIEDQLDPCFWEIVTNYVEWRGLYALGREDDSPLQPHMWEIPHGTMVPPSLRLTALGRKSDPCSDYTLTLGPAFPMSLECLNQNLEQFMLDCGGEVTPLRHWFTPEREVCKMFTNTIDLIRDEEEWLKSEGLYDDELLWEATHGYGKKRVVKR